MPKSVKKKSSASQDELVSCTNQGFARTHSIIIEQQVPASSSPKNVDPRPRTYDNFKNYYFELFDRLIPV